MIPILTDFPLIFFFFFHAEPPLIQLYHQLQDTPYFSPALDPPPSSTPNPPPPRPLNVVLINIHPGRGGAQQTENMNLDNLQSRDPFIARPTFPSRKRRRSGYIIIKVSRVFETTNDILFFLFLSPPPPPSPRGSSSWDKITKKMVETLAREDCCARLRWCLSRKKKEEEEEEETYICPRKCLKIWKIWKILILMKCI